MDKYLKNPNFKYIAIIIFIILILWLIYKIYKYTKSDSKCNGYWLATDEYLDIADLDFACAYIEGKVLVWLIQSDGKPTTQSYTFEKSKENSKLYNFLMIAGEGNPVLGENCKMYVDDDILSIQDDIILFEGEKMKES